ncbi:MAG TPA: DLW-39 family protein [Microlunatus sp.]|nr:DLW-39 family protein [Microlunatus sp.]
MKWTWVLALGAVAGGVVWAAYRKNQKELADAALWAEATDPVARPGGDR